MISELTQNAHPLIKLPKDYLVLDLSNGPVDVAKDQFAVGKYLEKRPNQYTGEHYQVIKSEDQRDIHLGIDICAPTNTDIFAPWDLKIFDRAYQSANKDYGYCLVGKLIWPGPKLFFLLGHLNKKSFDEVNFSKVYKKGEKIAEVGAPYENGNWQAHLHFQISYHRPNKCDMPGVCSEKDLAVFSAIYPDPQILIGKLY